MGTFKITGKSALGGSAAVHGAKNSVLPLLAAASIINGEVVLHNCPKLTDVENTVSILKYIGAKVKREGNTLIINSSDINKNAAPQNLMCEMRSSILFLGALSSRLKNSKIFLPGGCDIGARPIDLHLKALADLSGVISLDGNSVSCNMKNAAPSTVYLPFPSVGATENAILASVLLNGTTKIVNAAREPEISDLCNFLNKAGAKIRGASTPFIEIEGVNELHSVEHTVIPDRILAVTLMCAAAITKSELEIKNVNISHFYSELPVFVSMGCKLYLSDNSILIKPPKSLKRIKRIETKPYPGFSTDCQAPLCAVLSLARGRSEICETVFEKRFAYINELKRFGADITIKEKSAVINGVNSLNGAQVCCTDLRGGAALVIAALAANSTSLINNIEHIDRGYESLENQLSLIGADIVRIHNEKKRQSKTE